jgi:hypothetical protein
MLILLPRPDLGNPDPGLPPLPSNFRNPATRRLTGRRIDFDLLAQADVLKGGAAFSRAEKPLQRIPASAAESGRSPYPKLH